MSYKQSAAFLVFSAFLSGLIFGLGLIMAQMTNPAKVLGFLDVAGAWDPSLAFVMMGALTTLSLLQFFIRKSNQNKSEKLSKGAVTNSNIDAKLIIGSSLFGIGWGLSGLCPGPAIVGVTSGLTGLFVFVCAMLVGFMVFRLIHQKIKS